MVAKKEKKSVVARTPIAPLNTLFLKFELSNSLEFL
jgi:hypothetical protein